jgi:hypothetical protein
VKPTELVYSSHDRCEYLHRRWIVERALESADNKTILYLPCSSPSRGDQEYSWSTFSGYFDRFREWGLEPRHFYWSEELRREDAELFFRWLEGSQVVLLGGGMTTTGLERYADFGRRLGDPERFVRVLRERQARGMYNVGFSAGADQLCEWSCDGGVRCLGLIERVIVQLHYGPEHAGRVERLARTYADCFVVGLPNDSGIAVTQGRTPRGSRWQFIRFVTDESWDRPQDGFHIKTRQGVGIEYRGPDGRQWKFNGGDVMLRVLRDGEPQGEAFVAGPHYPGWIDFRTGEPTGVEDHARLIAER